MVDTVKPTLKDGKIVANQVTDKIYQKIEKGNLSTVHAIVVHQTGSKTSVSSFSSYNDGVNGAHFLIDIDGKIYQTARVNQKCWHIGEIRSRCYQFSTCTTAELKNIKEILFKQNKSYVTRVKDLYMHEKAKPYPDRYPTNEDSIGIEIVSGFTSDKGYDPLNDLQTSSLKWLINTLEDLLSLTSNDIYRHSEVGYKQPTEASSASW
jgi:N-acetyl-anhydromuramyl-L-alanine amidase AmpD